MPNTRSKISKTIAEVENINKSARARVIKTRSSNKETRQSLQNITNPKTVGIADVNIKQTSIAKQSLDHKLIVFDMGTDNNENLSAHSAVVPPEKCANPLVSEPDMEASLKRKCENSDSSDRVQMQGGTLESPSKRVKESEVELFIEAVNGLDSNDKNTILDVNAEAKVETVSIEDSERPSTSKAAQAAYAAYAANCDRSLNSSPQTIPNEYIAAIKPNSVTTPNLLSSPSSGCCLKRRRKIRTPQKQHSYPVASAPSDEQTIKTPLSVSEKLLLVVSNLYLNAGERLKLNFPPRCAEDLEHCHQSHYRAPLPTAPSHTQATNLRTALQQQRYLSFINLITDMCHRGEYPGLGVFTKLIELILSFNAKCYNSDSLSYFFNKSIELFSLFVRKFPPCWRSLRPLYVDFLQSPLDAEKISIKNKQFVKANKVLEILFELLTKTLERCSDADLQCEIDGFSNSSSSSTCATTPSSHKFTNFEDHNKSADLSQHSEYMNISEWEQRENRLQTFDELKFARTQLVRVFISLQLLLQILERDFVMWILHHHKKAKDWLFHTDSRPFAVLVFGMSKYACFTEAVQQLFTLFSVCTKRRALRSYLQILERYISLVMVASNIADLEYSEYGAVCYPNLGGSTKALIKNFFKLFKSYNATCVPSYLSAIDLLRLPYVRYEFIHSFLHCFQLTSQEPMTPKKIAQELLKKRWLKFKPKAELLLSESQHDDLLNREQYLMLLLTALQAYCDFYGLRAFFHMLINEENFECFRFVTDSVHRYPVEGSNSIMLESMAKDIVELEKRLRKTVRMAKPKACLPLIDISINEDLLQKYRNDLKYVTIIKNIIESVGKDVRTNSVDFTEWRQFLSTYTADKK